MEQLTCSIRRWITNELLEKKKENTNDIIRWSDINNSYTDSLKSMIINNNINMPSFQEEKMNNTYQNENIYSEPIFSKSSEKNNSDHTENIYSKIEFSDKKEENIQNCIEESNKLDIQKFFEDAKITFNNIPQNLEGKTSIRIEKDNDKEILVFDSIPNKNSDQTKVVKVKIIVPSRVFHQLDRKNITNIVNDISKSCKFKDADKTLEDTWTIDEKVLEHMINTSPNYKPIMGKKALLARVNATNNMNKNDSEIVKELVTERFRKFLENYYQKSFQRHISKLNTNSQESDVAFNVDSIEHSSSIDNNSNDSLTCTSYVSLNAANETYLVDHETSKLSINKSNSSKDSFENFHISSVGDLENEMNFNYLSTDEHNLEIMQSHLYDEVMDGGTYILSSSMEISDEVQYDSQQFLKDALGDEYISTEIKNISKPTSTGTINTSNVSTLISTRGNDLTYYDYNYDNENPYEDVISREKNPKLLDLQIDKTIQNQIMMQTSKALSLCRNTKEFVASNEEVEAERILLIAAMKIEAINQEMRQLEYQEIDVMQSNSYGCIKITEITFPPKLKSMSYGNSLNKKKKDEVQWYVCTITCGSRVFATKAIIPDEDGFLKFTEDVVFDNLGADFEMQVALHSMTLKNNLKRYSYESKYHLNKDVSTFCLISPSKLFKRIKEMKLPNQKEELNLTPSFSLGGIFTLNINTMKTDSGIFRLAHLPLFSPFEGSVILNFSTSLNINEIFSDFLNVGYEKNGCLIWSRKWCLLQGSFLLFFNYPGQETAVNVLDLKDCLSAQIISADREMCARPKTLVFESGVKDENGSISFIKKNFLSAENMQSFKMWSEKLNLILSALRNWNAMNF